MPHFETTHSSSKRTSPLHAAALLLACIIAVSTAGCGSSAPSSSAGSTAAAAKNLYPGTDGSDSVTLNIPNDPPQMNSMLTTDSVSGDILRMTVAGLVKLDANDQPQPDIAKSWDISPDKQTYTFHLRSGAKWSDGEPVTAQDFVFAWTTAMKPSTASQYAYMLTDNLENGSLFAEGKVPVEQVGVKATDPYTLQVKFNNPIPYALTLMSLFSYLPLPAKAYNQITNSGAKPDQYGRSPDTIVTNGPYRITEWTHDDHLTLTKNADYWDSSKMTIPTVKIRMIKDENAMLNAFKGGEVDEINLTGDQMAGLKAEGQKVTAYADGGVQFLVFNSIKAKKGLGNAKIRQALSMAIDSQSLCSNVLKNGSIAADGMVPPSISGVNGSYAKARGSVFAGYNKEKAKALLQQGLQEAGLQADQLSLSLTSSDDSVSQKTTAYLQEQWHTVLGISVKLQPMPAKSRFAAMDSGDFDIVLTNWYPDYNDPMTYLNTLTKKSGNNYGKYNNPRYDSLIKAATEQTNAAKRQDLLIQAEKLLMQDFPIAPLYFKGQCYITSAKLTGLTRTAFQDLDVCDGAKIVS